MQAQLTPAQFQEFCRQQHMRVYGVSTELLKIVSDYDLLRLEEWIASNIQLSRSQALKIWDVVCKTKWCQRTLKRKGRSNFENIFDQREHEVKQKAQELKEAKEKQAQLTHKYQINTNHHCLPRSFENISKLYQLFEAVISTQHDGSVDDQRRWHDCIKAFEQTKNEQFRQYEKSYILTDQAQGYLIAQGLSPSDYQYLKGTTLQHELEHQLCYIFEQAAYRQNKLSYSSNLLKQAVYCADAAHVTNSSELVRLTSLLEDVSYDYLSLHDDVNEYDLKFWIAFGKGVVCSAEKTIEMVLHPLKTAESLGKIIVEIKNMLPVSGNSCPCVFDHNGIQFDETRLQNSAQKIDAVCNGLVSLKREIISWMQNSSMEQKVENIGEIVADCVIPDIVLTKVGQCIGALAAQAKTLRTMEAAGVLLEEEWGLQKLLQLGIQQDEVAELLMQTEIGSELVSIGKSKGLIPVTEVLAECMQAEGQANKVMPAVVAGVKRTVAEKYDPLVVRYLLTELNYSKK